LALAITPSGPAQDIRRECLDHVIIFNERHLRRVVSSYFQYHHDARTHLSLHKDCPRPRPRFSYPLQGTTSSPFLRSAVCIIVMSDKRHDFEVDDHSHPNAQIDF
jgi:hypothetical protein